MSSKVIEIDNRPKSYAPTLSALLKDLGVPNPANAAIFVNQLAFWLNTKSGYFTKDGEKFVYNTYSHWRQQFPCLSESQIGRMVRSLCSLGIVVKETFSSLKRRLVNKPIGFQEYNQTSWMSLCVEKLVELADWVGYDPESLLSTNLQYCRLEDSVAQDASFKNEFSTIYTNIISISNPDEQTQGEKEIPSTFLNAQNPINPPVQQIDNEPKTPKQISHQYQANHENNIAVLNSEKPKNRINEYYKNESREERQRTEKYEWEIAVKRPYPVFLQWWADTKYKPQGGHWLVDAEGNAYSEFYNNVDRTTEVTYPKFLKYMNTVTESCNQVQQDGQKAILPTFFIPLPEATKENTEAVMSNIKTLVENGAAVLLPTKSTTPTSQSLPFAEAVGASTIKALPELKQLPDVHELRRQYYDLRGQTEAQVALLNELLSVGDDILTEEALKFARASKFNAEYSLDGAPVKIYDACVLPQPKPETLVSNVDWDALAQKCLDILDE